MRKLLTTFFYVGYVPGAPGTAASVVVAALAGVYFWHVSSPWPVAVAVLVLAGIGVGVGRWAIGHFGSKDPKQFVLDEAAGQALACVGATPALAGGFSLWVNVAAALVLFRIFDILKPPPVRQAERLPGGWGIVADDLVAGAVSAAVLLLANWLASPS